MRDMNTLNDTALILAHSRAVARPKKPEVRDSEMSLYLKAFHSFNRGQKPYVEPKPERGVVRVSHHITEADCRQFKSNVPATTPDESRSRVPAAPAVVVAGAPEQWHSEAPPVPGVYMSRRNSSLLRHPDIEADAPAVQSKPPLLWLRGDRVPESERDGLWFCDAGGRGCRHLRAYEAGFWIFDGTVTSRFLRAAPGVRAGDAFAPSLYAEVK